MALVQDKHDPAGLGMFSKAGRYTSEKYIIFQKKDEILYSKKHLPKTQSLIALPKENKEQVQPLQQQKQKKASKANDNQSNKKEEVTPFFKQMSREKVNTIMSIKHPTKPVGYYQPKFTQIDKSPHYIYNILDIFKKSKQPKQNNSDQQDSQGEDQMYSIPEKLSKKVLGFIDYGRQLDRDKVIQFVKNDPHPDRFLPLHLSESWSNMKKIPQFSYLKSLGRDDNKVYKTKEHQPDYKPNFEYGKKNLGKTVPNFAKIPPRKPFFKPSDTQTEHVYDYDFYVKQSKSQVFKIPQTINLEKMLPREADPNSPLPSFMQRHVNQRQTLTHLHYKMLEQNHFFDGRFQSTKSQFDPQASNKKKSEEDEDELIDQEQQMGDNENNNQYSQQL